MVILDIRCYQHEYALLNLTDFLFIMKIKKKILHTVDNSYF